jgi:uncharacterized protein (DUF58 family)
MKTATGLTLIAIGAILAFAVTANAWFFNVNVAGYVLMVIGLVGLFIPRRGYASISRRFVTRRQTWPNGSVVETRETQLPPYVVHNPGRAPEEVGLPGPQFPSIPPDRGVQEAAMGPDHPTPRETDRVDQVSDQ